MDDIIFKATTRGGRNFIEVTDTGTDTDRYMIKQDGAVDYANTIREVLAYLVKQSGWKEGTFDKIEIDTDHIGEQYLTILKMINKEFGFLYKSPKGSPERQYYFDIIRFIVQNIKNGTDMAIEDMIWKAKDALERKGIHSSRQIKSSQKGFENVAEGTRYDDYYIDTRGMGILDVENIIDAIESRGNQAVLTVQSSDGSVQHTYFTSKSWKDYKDTKNAQGVAVTDVWVTEVKGGSYVRNSHKITSGLDPYLCCPNCGEPELFENIKEHNIKCYNCGNTISYDELKNLKKYVSPHSKITSSMYKPKSVLNWMWYLPKEDYSTCLRKARMLGYQFTSDTDRNEWKEALENDSVLLDAIGDISKPEWFEIESSQQIKSARYIATDPESGEVLGSADTYEEAVNEWGEDVTITDSEASEGQEDMEGGLFSNRQITSGINDECIGTSKDGRYSIYKNDVDKVYMFAKDGYFTKEVDYDDPEVDGVLENWKEIYNIPLKSSKTETTKQFVTRILSELETGEITEDEAAEEIAEANDVNIGYARQILSSYIADKDRYITSGMLELGESLNVEFDPDGNLDSWSVDFATDPEKPAPTFGGELVRAARYIISAFRDDGEKIGWGYAREMLNPAARFIEENTDFSGVDAITDMLDGNIPDDESYRQWIDEFEIDFADYLRDHEEFFHKLNKADFTENTSKDDEYSDITEFYVEDEDGNKYWFSGDGEEYICDTIDYATDPDFTVGDVVTAEDYPYDSIDFDSEFGDFTEEPFDYSWEDGNGESVTISDVRLIGGMFDIDDFVSANEIAEMIDNGTGVYDSEDHELKISDIM